ncbi:hypothetical protein QFC20_004042 [Naganishia adeliensis]|uniref:Uncharacterized protein n=1 Tax=Naganishia adeliensis TaxID=92952 RepID=A0ACC2W5E3_9TREE|nr:hypothetical protein QFC20_004042 [Naganishia adeliensis]
MASSNPNRKPVPPYIPPQPILGRRVSMNSGTYETGGSVPWGQSRRVDSPYNQPPAYQSSDSVQRMEGYEEEYAAEPAVISTASLLLSDRNPLSNFEATVAASFPTRSPLPVPTPLPPHDPNYPGRFQFHPAPNYTSAQPTTPLAPRRTGISRLFGGRQSEYSVPEEQEAGLPSPVPNTRGNGTLRRRAMRSRSPTPMRDDEDLAVTTSLGYNGSPLNPHQNGRHAAKFDEKDAESVEGDFDDDDDRKRKYEYLEQFVYTREKEGCDIGDQELDVDASDEEEEEKELLTSKTAHWGPAPMGPIQRRGGDKKKKFDVKLTDGNLVMRLDIPLQLKESLRPFFPQEEMLQTSYTGVTCGPDDFVENHYSLRQIEARRETELMIVITMYNEDEVLFLRTLYGVVKNIAHLEGRKNSSTWGPGSWKKIVVCIVADGRANVHPRVLDILATMGTFQAGAMQSVIQDKEVKAHVFEHTTACVLTPDKMQFRFIDNKGVVPMQMIFCLKEKNAKKINSHRWFFNAFARTLDPTVCILLDVGTRPSPKSFYHLWKAFDKGADVGGACGEIAVYKGKRWSSLLNPLVAAQNFEYKISNILDKTTESVFGYCTVLPGAFSAYRWRALQNDETGKGPLASYFKGEELKGKDADTFTANMYLAEDRILCWEIVAKPNHRFRLKYVSAAVAHTDAPETIAEFISQRRRWLNGSLFALVYSLAHFFEVYRTKHSVIRKMAFTVQAFYNAINLVFQWFSLANFYIFFVILTSSLEDPAFGIPNIKYLNVIMQYGYLGIVVACLLFSMGNRPQGSMWKYRTAIYLLAALTVYMLVCAIICSVKAFQQIDNPIYARMVVSLLATYGVYVFASFIAMDPLHLLTSAGQYFLLQATYLNVLNVYAFSNLHDLSWGTKGADTAEPNLGVVKGTGSTVAVELLPPDGADAEYARSVENIKTRKAIPKPAGKTPSQMEQETKDYYANFRTNVLLAWVLSNAILASLILSGDTSTSFSSSSSVSSVYMMAVLRVNRMGTKPMDI